jgi:eukaryotic-like serine/threonine-protein kinase
MLGVAPSEGIVRWEGFVLDVRTAELRDANGKTTRLSQQPLQLLVALLECPGELVPRERLRKRLWPNDTVVEFEHSISTIMNRLRQVLGESAENPKFIETLARRGYRWKTPVEWEQPQAVAPRAPQLDGNLTGKRLSHYRVLEILGGGGMGVVYKAEDIKLGRRVALKFLPEELAGDAAAMQRLEREARAASGLNHPNICTIHAVEEHNGQPFIAMELLEGRNLRDLISEPTGDKSGRDTLPLERLLTIAVQIANGLEAAHQKGIIHRDIKPANIFVTNHGHVKILDFGLAKAHEFESASPPQAPQAGEVKPNANPLLTVTRTGITVGTAAYMSPEQVRGEKLDARTDLFAFGLVMYEMATRQRAFAGDTAPVLHHAILNHTPAPVRALRPQIPGKLEAVIDKAIQKDRAVRYQTASAVRADLMAFESGREGRRFRWWMAGAGVAGLLIASASFWFARYQQQVTPPSPDLKLRQLTANSPENPVEDGRISPDGKYIAYTDLKGIHVKTIGSDETRTLARPEALRDQEIEWALAAWSPDSTRLIANAHPAADAEYLSELQPDEDLSIWEFPLHGGTPRMLRSNAWADAISPDGSLISFRAHRSRSGSREVWVMDSTGGNARKIFENDAVGGLGWSPGGRRAWYLRSSGPELRDADFKWLSFPWENGRIVAGSSPTDITPSFGMDNTNDIAVLPDGRSLYSVRDGGSIGSETCNFWSQQRDPRTDKPLGKPRQLTHWTGFCMSDSSVTNDGKRLAFLEWSGHPALYVANFQTDRITDERHFTESESSELWVDWTPDSRSLIFLSNRSGRPGIYRQSLDAESPDLLVNPQKGLSACCVSPDGRWFIYRVHKGAGQPSSSSEEIMRVPATGGASENIFAVEHFNWWGCARAPSDLCVVAESTEDRKQMVLTSFDAVRGRGSELTRISVEANSDRAVALSPDGKRFALIRWPGKALELLSLKGEMLQEIKIPEWRAAGPIEWAADGQGLFVPSLRLGGASLLYVSLRGEVHVIRENRGGNYSPALPSPDGRHLAMVSTAMNSNMWMMENF